jgi:predicted unusual protein kinase regulating ubiquinone biosynthesis (AarF/ABC1/UbiB family)
MSFYAGTGREEIAELVPVLCDELNKVQDSVTADEVERAKRQIEAGLARSQESPMRRAERSANQIFDYGRIIPVSETMAKIDAVTVDSVMAVAGADLPGPSGGSRRWQAGQAQSLRRPSGPSRRLIGSGAVLRIAPVVVASLAPLRRER